MIHGKKTICAAVVLAAAVITGATPVMGDSVKIYWMDNGLDTINVMDASGTDPVVLAQTQAVPIGLAVDTAGGKIYWSDNGTAGDSSARGRVCRSNLDGTGIEVLYTTEKPQQHGSGQSLSQLALDPVEGHVYFREQDSSDYRIVRMESDGSGVQTIISGLARGTSVELDPIDRMLYFGTGYQFSTAKIERCDLSGGNRSVVVQAYAYSFSLDLAGGHIYGADWDAHRIFRVNMDGSDLIYIEGTDGTHRDVQRFGESLYYPERSRSGYEYYNHIMRSNLDGSNRTELLLIESYLPDMIQIAVVPEPATLSILALGGLAVLRKRRKR